MRRTGIPIALIVLVPLIILGCTPTPKATDDPGLSPKSMDVSDDLDAENYEGAEPAGDVSIVLDRVVRRMVGDDGGEQTEVYDFEYSQGELRTSVVHRDAGGRVHRADAFFNVDGTLSFVRMRDAGGNTKTVHFVYDSNGNPLERILSQDDVPIHKLEYNYEARKEYLRELKLYEWEDGRWKLANGRTITLYLNDRGFPSAFEVISPEGRRHVVFEYGNGADTIDDYIDTSFSVEGTETKVSGFVTYTDGRPSLMTVRSDAGAEEETRIVAQWKETALDMRQAGEVVKRCDPQGCDEVERRSFTYKARDFEPMMPPASIVAPVLELGSSLLFIEKPETLLGKEGIGLPSWIVF